MIHLIQNNAAVHELKTILFQKYGKEIKFLPVVDLEKVNVDFNELTQIERHQENDLEIKNISSFYFSKDQNLIFPIIVNNTYLTSAQVTNSTDLSLEDTGNLAQLIHQTLDPICYDFYLSDAPQTNVVQNYEFSTGFIYSNTNDAFLFQKFVSQIHDVSDRWALLKLKDLSLHSVYDLESLGAVTLVVDDLAQISPEQLEIVSEYLKVPRSHENPLILINSVNGEPGSESLIEDLKNSKIDLNYECLNEHYLKTLLSKAFRENFID
jgi:hypothetical protein